MKTVILTIVLIVASLTALACNGTKVYETEHMVREITTVADSASFEYFKAVESRFGIQLAKMVGVESYLLYKGQNGSQRVTVRIVNGENGTKKFVVIYNK